MGKTKCERWMARGDSACRNCADGCNARPDDPEYDSEAEFEAESGETAADECRWYDITIERREIVTKSHTFHIRARDRDEACDLAGEEACEFDWSEEDAYDWDDQDEVVDVGISNDQED